MAKIGRPGLSPEQKAELWKRWKGGQCASDIAQVLARTKGAIHHVLAAKGGIPPVARVGHPEASQPDRRGRLAARARIGATQSHSATPAGWAL